jgi:hypothetical protein
LTKPTTLNIPPASNTAFIEKSAVSTAAAILSASSHFLKLHTNISRNERIRPASTINKSIITTTAFSYEEDAVISSNKITASLLSFK